MSPIDVLRLLRPILEALDAAERAVAEQPPPSTPAAPATEPSGALTEPSGTLIKWASTDTYDGPCHWFPTELGPGSRIGVEPACSGSPTCVGAIGIVTESQEVEVHFGRDTLRALTAHLRALIAADLARDQSGQR